jgi:hypothetical protein
LLGICNIKKAQQVHDQRGWQVPVLRAGSLR